MHPTIILPERRHHCAPSGVINASEVTNGIEGDYKAEAAITQITALGAGNPSVL
jgi:hypothetical protein